MPSWYLSFCRQLILLCSSKQLWIFWLIFLRLLQCQNKPNIEPDMSYMKVLNIHKLCMYTLMRESHLFILNKGVHLWHLVWFLFWCHIIISCGQILGQSSRCPSSWCQWVDWSSLPIWGLVCVCVCVGDFVLCSVLETGAPGTFWFVSPVPCMDWATTTHTVKVQVNYTRLPRRSDVLFFHYQHQWPSDLIANTHEDINIRK